MDIKKTLKFIFLLVLLLFAIYSYFAIFKPAYVSYVNSCDPIQFEERYNSTYEVAGMTSMNLETGNITVTFNTGYEKDLGLYKHELVHVRQFEEERYFTCKNPIRFYFNEVEAYTAQELMPWSLFEWIYL